MRAGLVKANVCFDIVEAAASDVILDYQEGGISLVPDTEIKIGDVYDFSTKEIVVTSLEISAVKARKRLNLINKRTEFETWILTQTENDQDEWEYSPTFKSDNNDILVKGLKAIGIKKKDIDDFFISERRELKRVSESV